MTTRELITYRITIFLSLITISIIQVDRPLALFIETRLITLQEPFRRILAGIEFLDAYPISRYMIAGAVLIIAIVLYFRYRSFQRAKVFFFVGATMVSSRLITALLKMVFGRNRPHAFISDHSVKDFFGVGDSFPSGHATNYFCFFLPLVVLFPRFKWPLLIIPTFVALQRVVVNDHYLSDVFAGILVASSMTLLFQRVFKIESLFLPPKKAI